MEIYEKKKIWKCGNSFKNKKSLLLMKKLGIVAWDDLIIFRGKQLMHWWEKSELIHVEGMRKCRKTKNNINRGSKKWYVN